jgi:hypothetical protein
MDPSNNPNPPGAESSSAQDPATYSGPPSQKWTTDGYPIVDGKYLDLSTGELKMHVEGVDPFMGGPPSVSVYWQNRVSTGRGDQFLVISKQRTPVRDVTEYLARLGDFLRKGLCKVDSLNATRFDVYVVASSELSQLAFADALRESGLL